MNLNLGKLLNITKRTEAVSIQTKIAMLEFDVALKAGDQNKQEESRLKLHQLIDDQLDLQVEVSVFQEKQLEDFLKQMKR